MKLTLPMIEKALAEKRLQYMHKGNWYTCWRHGNTVSWKTSPHGRSYFKIPLRFNWRGNVTITHADRNNPRYRILDLHTFQAITLANGSE